jgi:hypothetical protein
MNYLEPQEKLQKETFELDFQFLIFNSPVGCSKIYGNLWKSKKFVINWKMFE